jgi:hypothetical protein
MQGFCVWLWGVAVGSLGLLVVSDRIPGVPPPCRCDRASEYELTRNRDAWRLRAESAEARADDLRLRLAAAEGPFGVPGHTVGQDAARRAEVGPPEPERIPPPPTPFPVP